MTQINLDKKLYEQVKDFVKGDRVEYPTLKCFVERAVKDKLRIELINRKEVRE